MKVKKLQDKEMVSRPFGLKITYAQWEELVTDFVQKDLDKRLNPEEKPNALRLYP